MPIEVIRCPNCGAPLPAEAAGGVVTCAYCGVAVTGIPAAAWGTGSVLDTGSADPAHAHRPRAWVGDHRYVILGRIAQGEASDVFLARRDARLTEMVVVKVLRSPADAEHLAREWKVLGELDDSTAQGASHFATLLPQRVAHGALTRDGRDPRPASVFRWRSGFVHSFVDVMHQYPKGVDPRAAVWMWRRTLEVLGWVHRSGYMHGAVLPEHLIVHARDHGVVLVGWSRAVRRAAPLDDLTMTARCMVQVLGGDPTRAQLPSSVPAPLAELLQRCASGFDADADAWSLKERVARTAQGIYGPARFHPFTMPGWTKPSGA